MKRNQTLGWMLTGVMGLGVCVALPSHAQSRTRDRERAAAAEESRNTRLSYDDLPGNVRRALDDERDGAKVLSVYKADRVDHDWYSVVVEGKRGRDRVIRVSPAGRILGNSVLDEAEVATYKESPERFYQTYQERVVTRDKYLYRDLDRVTATAANPERVSWDQIPGRVRATLIRESGGDKPDFVVRYREKDTVIYQTNIPEGRGAVHMLQVTPEGTIYNEGDFSRGGAAIKGDWRPRTLSFDDLPDRVKRTVDREAGNGRIAHVDVVNRGGRDIYTVDVDSRDETRYLTLDDGGKVLSDVSDRYNGR